MTHINPEAITQDEMLHALGNIEKAVRRGGLAKVYVLFTDDKGEHWDHVLGYGLVELMGVLETAKHMQLQSYVQATLSGFEQPRSAEEIAEHLQKLFAQRRVEDWPEDKHPPLWADLAPDEKQWWVAAVREALGSDG